MSRMIDPQFGADDLSQQNSFAFTLHITGCDEASEEIAEALFEAGCNDALFGSTDGQVWLNFDRAADSFAEAIMTAIEDVESVKGLKVLKVLPEGANVIRDANAFLRVRRKKSSRFWPFLQ